MKKGRGMKKEDWLSRKVQGEGWKKPGYWSVSSGVGVGGFDQFTQMRRREKNQNAKIKTGKQAYQFPFKKKSF